MNSENSCSLKDQQPKTIEILTKETKLYTAIQQSKVSVVKELIEQGANVNHIDKKGFHPLHLAAIAGNLEICTLLINSGAQINTPDAGGLTPLHYAANEGWDDVLDYFLSKGANPHLTNDDFVCYLGGTTIPLYITGGRTALHLASERGEDACVARLLQESIDPQVRDFDGNSAYDLALLHKREEIADLLKPFPDAPTEMDEKDIKDKRLKDHVNRSKRIPQKEREKSEKNRQSIIVQFKPKYPEIFSINESFFVKSFVDAVRSINQNEMMSILTEECPGVYSFDMLTPEFCRKLLEESENYEKSGLEVRRPNSMNSYGIVLDDIGFYKMINDIIENCILPYSKKLFKNGEKLDSHHAFIVKYKIGEDVDLSEHVDDSEITLNVCLGKEFEGGTLYFKGVKGEEFKEPVVYKHRMGRAVLHVGNHVHGANKIEGGERVNLIIWCRDSSVRRRF